MQIAGFAKGATSLTPALNIKHMIKNYIYISTLAAANSWAILFQLTASDLFIRTMRKIVWSENMLYGFKRNRSEDPSHRRSATELRPGPLSLQTVK